MSTNSLHPLNPKYSQPTNLAEFCRDLETAFAIRLKIQRVSLHCDVANDLLFDLPQELVRRILHSWIDDALEDMPDGGELDVTVVLGHGALEIEVADSRTGGADSTSRTSDHHPCIADGAAVDSCAAKALRVESTMCPQGGVARTVIIPATYSNTHDRVHGAWRKVA